MNLSMRITVAALVRSLRSMAHDLADRAEQDYHLARPGSGRESSRAHPRRAVTREDDDDSARR